MLVTVGMIGEPLEMPDVVVELTFSFFHLLFLVGDNTFVFLLVIDVASIVPSSL